MAKPVQNEENQQVTTYKCYPAFNFTHKGFLFDYNWSIGQNTQSKTIEFTLFAPH